MADNGSIPNFYILLDLNPDEPWDPVKLEQVLKSKQNEWTRDSMRAGTKARTAQKNLEYVPKIRSIIADEAQCKALAAAARAERASGSKARIEAFERQLAFAEKKGYLEKTEFDKLVTEYKDVLSEKEIRSRVRVDIRTAQQPGTAGQELEPSIVKEITDNLKIVNQEDLYQLLGLPPGSPSQLLYDAAEKLYLGLLKQPNKNAELTAQQTLAGHAQSIFKSEQKRKMYDESRRLSKLNALLKDLDDTVNLRPVKELRGGQVPAFLEDAAKIGFPRELAFEKLQAHAVQRKWFVESPTIDWSPQIRCGNCEAINDANRKFCFNCNAELVITCPNCGKSVQSDEFGCKYCGFPVGNRYWVSDLLNECRLALDMGNVEAAEQALKKAERAWELKKPDALGQKMLQYKAELQQIVQKRERNVEHLRQLIDKRNFYAARSFLTTVAPHDVLDRETSQRLVESEIARAQELLRRAQASSISSEQKVDLCVQALRICADCKEARDLLSTTPPEPPRNLQARPGATIVSLTWDLSPTRGAGYKIVRKSHSQPVSVKDGTLLGTVTGRMFDDTQPEYGVPIFYAVFAAFEDILSTQAATLRQPVLLTQDVTNIVVRVNNQVVDLEWKVPEHTQQVVVVRKERTPPNSPDDGKRMQLVDLSHLVDRDVQNGQSYYYAIYCQFKDFDGRLISSKGVVTQATPEMPPAVITTFEITSTKMANGHEVKLRWQPPNKGRVAVLESRQPPPFEVGETVALATVQRLGDLREDRPDGLTRMVPLAGIQYYTPIVIFQNMAYVGATQRFVCVDDVSNLKYQNLGSVLRLQWTWPETCKEVLVTYRNDDWPLPHEAMTNTYKVTRAEYDYLGHYDIRGVQNQDYYIVVAALVRQGNEQVIGSGARVRARLASKVVVEYEIKSRGLFGPKKRLLQVYVRTPGELPTLVVVSKQGRLPLNKAEGAVMHRVEGPVQIEKEMAIELPDRPFPPRTFVKLYLEDDSLYEVVTIHHPSEDKLRLS